MTTSDQPPAGAPRPDQPGRYRRRPQYPQEQLTDLRFSGHNHQELAQFANGSIRFLQPANRAQTADSSPDCSDFHQFGRELAAALLLPGKSVVQNIRVNDFLVKVLTTTTSDAVADDPPLVYETGYFVLRAQDYETYSRDTDHPPDRPHPITEPPPQEPSVTPVQIFVYAVQFNGANQDQLIGLAGNRISVQEAWDPVTNDRTLTPLLGSNYASAEAIHPGDWLTEFNGFPGEEPRPPVYIIENNARFHALHEPATDN